MFRKISLVLIAVLVINMHTSPYAYAKRVSKNESVALSLNTYEVSDETLEVYSKPTTDARSLFVLYKGMDITPTESIFKDGYKWFKFGPQGYWVIAVQPSGYTNLHRLNLNRSHIEDQYGILDQPHNYAVKMVKFPGATARIETYMKVNGVYKLQNTYGGSYPNDGPKDEYGDYKTVGGNVIRYLYRTTRTGMGGKDSKGNDFGAYKVAFPMPHDGYERLMKGTLTTYQYAKLPAINKRSNGDFFPHPGSNMGADIVLHTQKKGSRGCIMVENEMMSYLYNHDLITVNDREIIPFVIYDEDVVAPPIGQLL